MKTKRINIRCYDNGGKTCDRYTVIYLDCPTKGGCYESVGMNETPFHPQGFGQHGECKPGRHLGKLIGFSDLPADCQKLVQQDLAPATKPLPLSAMKAGAQ